MPKFVVPVPKFPARCGCGRFHGRRYRQVKGGPAHCFIPLGSAPGIYDPEIHESDAPRVNLSKPPFKCQECQKRG